jgi:hypothetical protein
VRLAVEAGVKHTRLVALVALVIDVKDDRGLMLYRSVVPTAQEIKADTLQPLSYKRVRSILDTMRAYGIYPVARIVVAKDPLLALGKPEYAIKRRDDSTRSWLDQDGQPWLDPTHPEVWKYAADIAAEAVRMGFSEVQFDYVRFPDEDRIVKEGTYARMNGRVRAQVIRDQLAYLRIAFLTVKDDLEATIHHGCRCIELRRWDPIATVQRLLQPAAAEALY